MRGHRLRGLILKQKHAHIVLYKQKTLHRSSVHLALCLSKLSAIKGALTFTVVVSCAAHGGVTQLRIKLILF